MIAAAPALLVLWMSLPIEPLAQAPDDPGIARRIEGWPRPAETPDASADGAQETPSQAAPAPAAPAPTVAETVCVAPGQTATTAPVVTAVPDVRTPLWARRGPGLLLSYRQFGFVRVGAVDPSQGSGAMPQTFHVLSLDLIPISWLLRISISPEFGWASGGDYFVAMAGGIGLQWPALITPYAQFNIGGGYMRREQFGITMPTAFVELGVDVGASVRLAPHLWLNAALGYVRPVNWFLRETSPVGVYSDAFTFKVGFGL